MKDIFIILAAPIFLLAGVTAHVRPWEPLPQIPEPRERLEGAFVEFDPRRKMLEIDCEESARLLIEEGPVKMIHVYAVSLCDVLSDFAKEKNL